MKLSVIIPVYNATFISRALDSIYSQGMKEDEFEVICVDDCSPNNIYEVMTDYLYEGRHPENLIILRHSVNKRQGGARNTGIRAARGKWILFLDDDDFFVEDTFDKLLEEAEKDPMLDTLMFNSYAGDGSMENAKVLITQHLDMRTMTGVEFLQTNQIPYNPWCYIYRRDHLLATGFFFEENTRFEDADFELKYTAHSEGIRFLPLMVHYWVLHPDQTSNDIGKSPKLMMDHLYLVCRMYRVAMEERSHSPIASKVIMKNAMTTFRGFVRWCYWKPSFRNLLTAFRKYRLAEPTGDRLFDFVNRHPLFAAIAITALKPYFFLTEKVWRHLKEWLKRIFSK